MEQGEDYRGKGVGKEGRREGGGERTPRMGNHTTTHTHHRKRPSFWCPKICKFSLNTKLITPHVKGKRKAEKRKQITCRN
jgi:hypothetical protein